MDRKATARQTMEILKQGFYLYNGSQVDIQQIQQYSCDNSILITPQEGQSLIPKYSRSEMIKENPSEEKNIGMPMDETNQNFIACGYAVENCSTVDAILQLTDGRAENIGVLNFASAKNPGGGFLNGAMAQEESLAASSGLYDTLTLHKTYYEANRSCKTMIYTDHAIYSPGVVFFRDGSFHLLPSPVLANILTLPAVNMGQVLLKGESKEKAEEAMYHRMKLALAIFAHKNCQNLILGAYGCGVFRNNPSQIAQWWRTLLEQEFYGYFNRVLFAVLDHSAKQNSIHAFETVFPLNDTLLP